MFHSYVKLPEGNFKLTHVVFMTEQQGEKCIVCIEVKELDQLWLLYVFRRITNHCWENTNNTNTGQITGVMKIRNMRVRMGEVTGSTVVWYLASSICQDSSEMLHHYATTG